MDDSVFVTIEAGDVDAVATAAATFAAVDDVTIVSGGGTDRGVIRLETSRPFLDLDLAEHGAIFREATADSSGTTIVVDVPEGIDVRNVAGLVRETFPAAELERKETTDRRATDDPHSRFLDELTERQLEVVRTAHYSGYFESPRENSGEDVAIVLGISSPAFYQHVRTVQRKLFDTVFDA